MKISVTEITAILTLSMNVNTFILLKQNETISSFTLQASWPGRGKVSQNCSCSLQISHSTEGSSSYGRSPA